MQLTSVKPQLRAAIPKKELTMTEFPFQWVIDLISKKAANAAFFYYILISGLILIKK